MTNYVLDCFYPLQLRLMRCIVSYLCVAHCDCAASVERHGRRMHVAMVAQDLVVSKQPEAFHTHDIPSVHGSGAFGLSLTIQYPGYLSGELGLPRPSRLEPCSLATLDR